MLHSFSPRVWAEQLPPEGPVLPLTPPHASRTYLTPQPDEDRPMAGTIAWDRGSLPKPKPARATAAASVGWG